jgi:hypothetical protein
MARWFTWLNQHGLLPGLVLLAVSVVVIGQDILRHYRRQPGEPEKPAFTALAPVWQEPVTVPIEEVEGGAWERWWVVVRGVVTPDGADGRDWVGISADGRQTRVVLVFRPRDFRRCRVGQVVSVEGYQRGFVRGVVEVVECHFQDPPPAGH